MQIIPVSFVTVAPRPTAVVAQTTTWARFPEVWGRLLDEVYGFVRGREDLATGDGAERWQNVMLYKNDTPEVEVGVLAAGPFAAQGRVTRPSYPAGRSRPRSTAATTPASAPRTTPCATTSRPMDAS